MVKYSQKVKKKYTVEKKTLLKTSHKKYSKKHTVHR